jgi:cytochrome c peroxidase
MTVFKVSLSVGAMILAAAGLGSIAVAEGQAPGDDTFNSIVGDDCDGERCIAVARGLFDFLDRRLHGLKGNGRACADCHMLSDHFQLSPADVEARFQNLQARRLANPHADDPLFRPVDANDYRVNGDSASDFSNLRENALIRITFPLPANVKLLDCGSAVPCPATALPSSETSVDVWRMVPTVNNVKLTGPDGLDPWPRGPNPSGGYQLDGRFATLQVQALAALTAHAEIQVAPQQGMLDDLGAFESVLFSSRGVRRLSNAVSAGVTPLPDADPPLNELEQAGKVVFTRACGQCHGGPGQSTPQAPAVHYHDISTQCPRPVDTANSPPLYVFKPCPASLARNVRSYEITLPKGVTSPNGSSTIRRTSSDPGRALLTGFATLGPPAADDWNKFDVPSLRGISKTAPYFHNNSAATLEEVVAHYTAFFKRVQANVQAGNKLPPAISTDGVNADRPQLPEEVPALLAYLRKL